jgi:hypothetical protein
MLAALAAVSAKDFLTNCVSEVVGGSTEADRCDCQFPDWDGPEWASSTSTTTVATRIEVRLEE